MGNFDGLIPSLIIFGAMIVAVIWGCWELVDLFFIDDAIRTTEPIIPEIELVVKENVVDTLYVYRKP